MSAWLRPVTMAALAATFLAAAPAAAQSPAAQADKLNKEGKLLFDKKDYEGAHGKFKEAATLSPEGRFFFNACFALNFLGRYEEAIQACEQVEPAGADPKLTDKTRKALASLREKAATQRAEPASATRPGVDGGQGAEGRRVQGREPADQPGPSGPPPPPPQGGPDPFIAAQAPPPDGSYRWSLGGSVGGLANINVGRRGDFEGSEIYGEAGGDLRLFANVIVSQAARLGVQGSLGFGSIVSEDANSYDNNLGIGDIGASLFLHLPLGSRMSLTPLVGPMLSVQTPNELSQGFIAFGTRTELGFSYAFGRGLEHAVTFTPALNVYFPASGDVEGFDPEDFGLDVIHSTFGIAIGYQYRFSTPFGALPIITLE